MKNAPSRLEGAKKESVEQPVGGGSQPATDERNVVFRGVCFRTGVTSYGQGQLAALGESIITDGSDGVRNGKGCQRSTFGKCRISDGGDGLGDMGRNQRGTFGKCKVSNGGDGFGNYDGNQRGAFRECVIADREEGIGERNRC